MAENRVITETILQQIGGKRFIIMTGAQKLCETERGLGFMIPGKLSMDGINAVRITLEFNDTYTMKFMRMTPTKLKVIAEVTDVYCDQLETIFTGRTGLLTHF